MKKSLIGLIATVALLLGLASFAGFPPSYLLSAPGVATGIGSKLLCSARYVSGFSEQQSFDDLVQYSGILQELTVEFDSNERTVTTSLFGWSEKTANYLPNIGCAIDYSGYSQRTSLRTQEPQLSNAPWPLGDSVGAADARIQELLQRLLGVDNELGLELYKSLTWDRGSEITNHQRFTLETNIKVYLCDPQCPWQRGSNENTNRLLRQYLPKGTDLSIHTQTQLNKIARELNERPRKTLEYETPAARFNACVALTG